MRSAAQLSDTLRAIDGKGYGAYKTILGAYGFAEFDLHIDYVQGDPFATPSRLRAVLPASVVRLPLGVVASRIRRKAAADYLNRKIVAALAAASRPRGSGVSGSIDILRPGQQILERTSLQINQTGDLVVRLTAGLPARGRRVMGRAASEMLTEDIPKAIRASLLAAAIDLDALTGHADLAEDSAALREQLDERDLVALVPNGAILPRRSGIDDRPLPRRDAVEFRSPDSLAVSLNAPHRGSVTGMGVPKGVTLIVGGGYHGKSTLLRAIESGIYDHISGDGRELAVTLRDAVKVRAEDGRRIAAVDISNFISGLPRGEDTRRFSTDNASGSTSQAAAIAEAIEVGTKCLLIDEDTSATNFMIRDARMQALIHDEDEPIIPFIDRARQLHAELGISTVIVVGGAGDYFDVADTVIGMRAYLPADLTAEAKKVAASFETHRRREGGNWSPLLSRVPHPASIDPRKGRKAVSIKVPTRARVLFGTEELDLSALEQLVEMGQARAVAQALAYGTNRWIDGKRTVAEAMKGLRDEIGERGLDVIDSRQVGDYAEFRVYELAAALGRLRTLRIDAGDTA